MTYLNLRSKILLSVGLIVFIVLGINTFVHIHELRRDYLEAINWHSEALTQNIQNTIMDRVNSLVFAGIRLDNQQVRTVLNSSTLECMKVYESNKDKDVSFVAIVDQNGVITAHNEQNMWETSVQSPVVLDYLRRQEQTTVLDDTTYHTLVPVFGSDDLYLGTIDIGTPRKLVDRKISTVILHSITVFIIFLFLAFFTVSIFVHLTITKPIRQVVTFGYQLADGNLVQIPDQTKRDEISTLKTTFNDISAYLQNIAGVAAKIATGTMTGEIQARSDHDVLGQSVHRMVNYLKHVATVATKIAGGDLTETIRVRSTDDAFGKTLQTMTEGLRSLIVHIRTGAEQIATTGTNISTLAAQDIKIVEQVDTSSEEMTSTMRELGASVEEVAHNMDTLSASVEVTSSSATQMTSSITHIVAKTNDLTEQSQQTIKALNTTLALLEEVVESTDTSKHLSQDTIQDALQGQEAVEQVIASMQTIHRTTLTSMEAITRFAQRSQDIDTILDVIREITDQTSLLALNASIIAAQAGAHGRGFAVVADEIRNLATGVGNSTKDIANIVRTLQQDTQNIVQTIHEGAEDVTQGMERTQQAREALQKIITSAERSSGVVKEIAETLHGLMATTRQLSTAMEHVNLMTDEITSSTNQQQASTHQINQAIVHINDMASQIQHATTEQLSGVRQLLQMMNGVAGFIRQNLQSSRHIVETTTELSSQADMLLHSVDRFKL